MGILITLHPHCHGLKHKIDRHARYTGINRYFFGVVKDTYEKNLPSNDVLLASNHDFTMLLLRSLGEIGGGDRGG